ncbi:MAG TPA: MogA/MoaB family molybdenum cofactor biosynthesis protein [Terriglobales bacterium]|nr:MogA/MoaB family molybdenum cofactor biosynthesis protein [Terriglobales bacterium]
MSSSTPDASLDKTSDRTTAAVLTVSDSCFRGEQRGGKKDLSGPAVAEALERRNFRVVLRSVVADERAAIQEKLIELCRWARLVVTTGGTGIAPRDVTPEATGAVCERLVEGIAEQMRIQGARKTRFAALSRAVCGVRGTSLILNLPGSPAGAVESLEAVLDLLPHALELIAGKTEHEGR